MNYNEGILLVDKPSGLTSHDIVDFVRKEFGFKKVGHAGTLDPAATGLLIILIGSFTKRSAFFSGYDKEYEARLRLGVSTDTGDKEGRILEERDWNLYAEDIKNIEETLMAFRGEIRQVPPMYSAKKIKGRKLYEFARMGVVLERRPRLVSIREISVSDVSPPYIDFFVRCSKGTYIRQLAHDIGEMIGCGAHLVSLRRTKIGPFSVGEAVPFANLSYENILQPA